MLAHLENELLVLIDLDVKLLEDRTCKGDVDLPGTLSEDQTGLDGILIPAEQYVRPNGLR